MDALTSDKGLLIRLRWYVCLYPASLSCQRSSQVEMLNSLLIVKKNRRPMVW
jgi:hypothetical protein